MSEVAAPATTQPDVERTLPARYLTSRRIQRVGYILLGLQLAGFFAWSAVLYSRFSVTSDFATYNQPWFLIAHGNLDPTSTLLRIPFWRSDSEFMPWVLAPFYWIGRSGLILSWLQDVSVAVAEAVAFTWLCELARHHCKERDAVWLTGLGLLLLIANPWIWWAVSFDVHEESLIIAFAALLAWDLSRGRRRAWVWVAPVLAGGAPSATYVIGMGLGAVLAGGGKRRAGIGMALLGAAYSGLIVLLHGDLGVPLTGHYGYLAAVGGHIPANLSLSGLAKGIASHPLRAPLVLWDKRFDIIANLAPSGLLGLGSPLLLPLIIVVLLANCLSHGLEFAQPLFQSLPIYVLVPVGTVTVLCWLIRHHRRAALAVAGLIAAQTLGWAVVWGPQTPGEWLRVPVPAAATLASIDARIPPSAELIASQGVAGRFSDRTQLYELYGVGNTLPVHGLTWFVIAPAIGIETLSVGSTTTLIGELAGPLGATLITHANGVWAFRWTPPPGVNQIVVPDGSAPLPAWAAAGTAGRPVTTGAVSGWRMASTGGSGYVADGLEWLEPPGKYFATVTLSASKPVNVEVWDDTTDTLLARRTITATGGIDQVRLSVSAPRAPDANVYAGWGPFRADFSLPAPGQLLEVRVWSPGGVAVNVYSAELTAQGPGRVAAMP